MWIFRALAVFGPPVAGVVAYRVCIGLQEGEGVEHDRRRAVAEAKLAGAGSNDRTVA
jgi:hypothetical protein